MHYVLKRKKDMMAVSFNLGGIEAFTRQLWNLRRIAFKHLLYCGTFDGELSLCFPVSNLMNHSSGILDLSFSFLSGT